MSLAGSLSDLSLPELLQVVALSRKTGALRIRASDGQEAWLGLDRGGVVRVATSDGRLALAKILGSQELDGGASPGAAEGAVWDAAVQAVLSLFEWREGEFTFEPGPDPSQHWTGPEGLQLPNALSPEFLALEGARLEDELASSSAPVAEPASLPELVFDLTEPIFDTDPPATAEPGSLGPAPVAGPDATPASQHEPQPELEPLICVDPDLGLLEALKDPLAAQGRRVHIFQDAESALTRIKQYVLRGEFPALLLGSDVPDPLEGHRGKGWQRFAQRVQALAPRVSIVVMAAAALVPPEGVRAVARPSATSESLEPFLRALLDALASRA